MKTIMRSKDKLQTLERKIWFENIKNQTTLPESDYVIAE